MNSTATVRIGLLQAGESHSENGNPGINANRSLFERLAAEAASSSPDIIIFPEYSLSGWPYPSEEEMNSLAEGIPGDGPHYRWYADLAQRIGVPLVCWLVERAEGRLYSTAVIVDERGSFVGSYRKVHANLGEQTWWGWRRGDVLMPIRLHGMSIGISICADMWYPETVRCMALQGADLHVHLSIADDMQDIIPVRAKDNGIPIAASIFNGGSFAVDAEGRLIEKLERSSAGWSVVEVRPFEVHTATKYGGLWIPKAGHLNVRNPAAYSALVDPDTRPPWTEVFLDSAGRRQTRSQLLARFGGRYDVDDPEVSQTQSIGFEGLWSSAYRVDSQYPHHLVNDEGRHPFILNKTAWAYFACRDPRTVVERAREQGVTILRVALEGAPYFDSLGYDLWPWAGTRERPDFGGFNEAYWRQVEERTRLAGDHGVGLDIVLYSALHPTVDDVGPQTSYWSRVVERLGRFANVLTWEIMNEYTQNEHFVDAAGAWLKAHDPFGRPVCSSDGTTDDALWPEKPWMDLGVNHSCTSSTERHPLREWYLAVARNTRSHGKPAFCNESGREVRHHNDDPIHRRKQGWIWCSSGGYWTYHSWEGCEGIDDFSYHGPGAEFLKPLADYFQTLPFWRMAPNRTALTLERPSSKEASIDSSCCAPLVVTLAEAERRIVSAYICTEETGAQVVSRTVRLRLPDGEYRIDYVDPATGEAIESTELRSRGIGVLRMIQLPDFMDDLVVRIEVVRWAPRTHIEGTQ